MTVEPFKPEHLDEIDLQPGQASWREYRRPEYAAELARHTAVTARAEGRIVACAGVVPVDAEGGMVWALVARDAGRYFLRFRGMVRRLLEVSGKKRFFANTECEFDAGCRWLELLGFTRQPDLLPAFGPDGRDHYLYEKVN
jgi:hypothetical protein